MGLVLLDFFEKVLWIDPSLPLHQLQGGPSSNLGRETLLSESKKMDFVVRLKSFVVGGLPR